MPVKHALLALLAERDLTGYELKLRFERVLGDFWQLNSGQVYSTLERMRRAGMVMRRSPHPAGRSLPARADDDGGDERADAARVAFAITPRGRRALSQWIATPVARLRPVRDPLYVKLAFSGPELVPLLLRAFAHETRRYGEATETLRALVAREPMSHGGRVRWLVAEAARLSYEAQLAWLDCVQQTLARAARPPGADVPPRRAVRPLVDQREAVA
jgi:DNA-binding PadR family transcriptional regulator